MSRRRPPAASTDPFRGSKDPAELDALAAAGAAESGLSAEVCDLVRLLVDALPSPDRDVVEMLVWQRLPVQEVAAQLGMSRNGVMAARARALAELKEGLRGVRW